MEGKKFFAAGIFVSVFAACAAAVGNSPPEKPTLSMIKSYDRVQMFAHVLSTSDATMADFDNKYVTFLVPRDSTCEAGQATFIKSLTSKETAKAYILDHAIVGQFAIIKNGDRIKSVDYFHDKKSFEHVTLEEASHIDVQLMSGREVVVSLDRGTLRIGNEAAVLGGLMYGAFDGGMLELDHCAAF
ncbi:MAG TPA: hypothetical protein VNZ27_04705 [Rhodanobacter sp.]|jgi:hypothetical protein|nr:hypothetical protein [Rhodanobacter sp.]